MKLILMLGYPRSGGTLLTKILKTDKSAIVLSEIGYSRGVSTSNESVNSALAVSDQLSKWYNLELTSVDFESQLEELQEKCEKNEKTLFIRDWTYSSFVKVDGQERDPGRSLELLDFLSTNKDLRVFALTRNAIDIYLSLRGGLNDFSSAYLAYCRCIRDANVPLVAYEDLVLNPGPTIQQIASITQYDWEVDFAKFEHSDATGDTQLGKISRGHGLGKIADLPRRKMSRKLARQLASCADLEKANRILNYDSNLGGKKMETKSAQLRRLTYEKFYLILSKIKARK